MADRVDQWERVIAMTAIKDIRLRDFHALRWDEPLLMEKSVPGERGVLVPQAEEGIRDLVGDGVSVLGDLARKTLPALPEIAQSLLIRHYTRITAQNLGSDNSLKISDGTCTTKYNPKVQEHLAARHPGFTEVHPLQDPDTMQGILEICYRTEQFLKEVSGLDRFSFQPGGGAHAVCSNASIIRAYHRSRGDHTRSEIITSIHTHPCNAATPALNGFKVITLMPKDDGLPDIEEFKAACGERTAAFFFTNPEDTGIYNAKIREYTNTAHAAGALCSYDQANGNAVMGIARAREAGFDLCHFNLHKTFSSPHGGFGPGCGAQGVKGFLAPFLPVPTIEYDGRRYFFDYNRPQTIGKVRSFYGNIGAVLRTYMWIRTLGADGLREASIIAVLNNQYLTKRIMEEVPGVTLHFDKGQRRMEQTRFSFDKLLEETGCGIDDVNNRLVDYGVPEIFESHHPLTVPEPFTPEPCESYSKADLDYYVAVLRKVALECYENPEMVKKAPHRASKHRPVNPFAEEYPEIASTWRQYVKKYRDAGGAETDG